MDVALVTGSAGLVGSAAVEVFSEAGYEIVGIDDDSRARFFGPEASTASRRRELEAAIPSYHHELVDVRDERAVDRIFATYGFDIRCVIHAAGQPSHDWAAHDPRTDFDINARASLQLLERTRARCPEAAFIFMSTNKVYGDGPNQLPLVESATRWELDATHPYFEHGIDESMSVDRCTHSLFGASKLAADVMVQEYGRYFGMDTVSFRAGCVTGPAHAGASQHGFLSFLVKCAVEGREYPILGYRGKQVRDNLHARDLAAMFLEFVRKPRKGEVYNAGGGRRIHCSLLEAVAALERLTGEKMRTRYVDEPRVGDHIWYVSDTRRFETHYPAWKRRYDLDAILAELVDACRLKPAP
jgi:CDP-paratose 2-epimerase